MAELRARDLREQRLSSLNLQYPLWIFEADDPRWPRRLTSLLPTSHPAQMTGWVASISEYALHLDPLQDLSNSSEGAAPMTRDQYTKLALRAFTQLRYDDTYTSDSLQVTFDDHGEHITKPFSSWAFDSQDPDFVHPANVLRIERAWDNVPLWDPKQGLERLSDFSPPIFGIATLVADDDELIFAAGFQKTDSGEGIRKAEFQCLDAGSAGGGWARGVVCPPRWVEPGDQGLKVQRGPDDKRNQQLLAGTLLQSAVWKEVEEYAKGMRPEPLWR